MKTLNVLHMKARPRIGYIPQYTYDVGQECSIINNSQYYRRISDYYPMNKVNIIEDIGCGLYEVNPVLTNDILLVSHWDIVPKCDIVESGLFAPIGLMYPGTIVRTISDKKINIIMENNGDYVHMIDDSKVGKGELVVVMVMPGKVVLAESAIAEIEPIESIKPIEPINNDEGDIGKKLETARKYFATRDEFEKFVKDISDKMTVMRDVFNKMGDAFGKK